LADITQLRFGNLLKQTLGIKAGDSGRSVPSYIIPVNEVQDAYRPEFRAPRGERLWGMNRTQVTTANINFGACVLPNVVGSNKLIVVKRAWVSLLLPTAVQQPGRTHFDIVLNVVGQTPANGANAKDGRYYLPISGNAQKGVATLVGITSGTTTLADFLGSFSIELFPGAAAVPTLLQLDNLDLVLCPGTQAEFYLRSDVISTLTYNWLLTLEGYERTADQNEIVPPQP